jgi:hypothetical protein
MFQGVSRGTVREPISAPLYHGDTARFKMGGVLMATFLRVAAILCALAAHGALIWAHRHDAAICPCHTLLLIAFLLNLAWEHRPREPGDE